VIEKKRKPFSFTSLPSSSFQPACSAAQLSFLRAAHLRLQFQPSSPAQPLLWLARPASRLPCVCAPLLPPTCGPRMSSLPCRATSRTRVRVGVAPEANSARRPRHLARAHGSAHLGPPPYKAAATLSVLAPVAETLVTQRRRRPCRAAAVDPSSRRLPSPSSHLRAFAAR
jgi:hypothetical protein